MEAEINVLVATKLVQAVLDLYLLSVWNVTRDIITFRLLLLAFLNVPLPFILTILLKVVPLVMENVLTVQLSLIIVHNVQQITLK